MSSSGYKPKPRNLRNASNVMHITQDRAIILIWLCQVYQQNRQYYSRFGVRQIINANRYVGKMIVHYSIHRRCWGRSRHWQNEMRRMVRELTAGGVTCVCVDPLWEKMHSSGMKSTPHKWKNDAVVTTTLGDHIQQRILFAHRAMSSWSRCLKASQEGLLGRAPVAFIALASGYCSAEQRAHATKLAQDIVADPEYRDTTYGVKYAVDCDELGIDIECVEGLASDDYGGKLVFLDSTEDAVVSQAASRVKHGPTDRWRNNPSKISVSKALDEWLKKRDKACDVIEVKLNM